MNDHFSYPIGCAGPRQWRRSLCGLLFLAGLVSSLAAVQAQQRLPQQAASATRRGTPRATEPSVPGSARLPKAAPRSVTFTPEREAAALTFVRTNRPELLSVLEGLKGDKPAEYQRAICDFFWISEALARLHDDDPRLHELALRSWKLEAQTHFLASQLAGQPADAQLRAELAQAAEQLVVAQLETAEYEVKRLEAQFRRAQDRHKRLVAQRDDLVRQRIDAITQAIEKSASAASAPRENP